MSHDLYIEDAEKEGNEELTEFFRRVREEDRDRAAEARTLLAERTPTASRVDGATTGVSVGTEMVGSFPAAGDASPGSAEVATSPRLEPSDDFPGTEPVEGDDRRQEPVSGCPRRRKYHRRGWERSRWPKKSRLRGRKRYQR